MEAHPLLKIVIAGDAQVGKTSLVRQFCQGVFDPEAAAVVGVDFQSKLVTLPGMTVKLSLWDLPGEPRFAAVREGFYRGSLAAILVYDLTSANTLKSLADWYKEIMQIIPSQHFLVAGNKSDLVETTEDRIGLEFARIIHAEYVRTSAKSGWGVDDLFKKAALVALERSNAKTPSPTSGSAT